jgi:hypothetical protein
MSKRNNLSFQKLILVGGPHLDPNLLNHMDR